MLTLSSEFHSSQWSPFCSLQKTILSITSEAIAHALDSPSQMLLPFMCALIPKLGVFFLHASAQGTSLELLEPRSAASYGKKQKQNSGSFDRNCSLAQPLLFLSSYSLALLASPGSTSFISHLHTHSHLRIRQACRTAL